jgi:N-methylhydantoinase B/oxoprolinase/acetone carboxylase alpha subunit
MAVAPPVKRVSRAKSWNFSSARSAFIQSAFESVLSELIETGHATTIVQSAGSSSGSSSGPASSRSIGQAILQLHPTAPPDLATLPQAAMTCQHFLKLKSGDLALVNDPSSGSFSLSTFTCVTVASLPDGDLLIAARFETPRRLSASGKPDDEGVRVPPMPIASKKILNKDILMAMSMHPAASPDLRERVETAAALLFEAARKLEALARSPGSTFDQASFANYLEDSGTTFETSLAKLPLGTSIVSARVLGSNEVIKLTLELSEKHVQFDFKGTETSQKVGLSELTTLGTCIWSVLALLGERVPLTSSVLGHFQVSAPTNTLLASRAQTSLERGLSLVVPLLGELTHQALAKVNPALKRAATAGTDALAQIEFANGKTVMLAASPGTAALASEAGQDAHGAWNPQTLLQLEKSEALAPLTWTASSLRIGSGGKGLKRGGDAELIACRVLEAAKVRWLLGRSTHRPEGSSGGRSGASAEIEIVRADGTKQTFETLEGVTDLAVGDEVRLHAAGGGAWGEVSSEKPEKKSDA